MYQTVSSSLLLFFAELKPIIILDVFQVDCFVSCFCFHLFLLIYFLLYSFIYLPYPYLRDFAVVCDVNSAKNSNPKSFHCFKLKTKKM